MTIRSPLAALALLLVAATACDDDKPSGNSIRTETLPVNHARCPHGGTAVYVNNVPSYICNGAPGNAGAGATSQIVPLGDSTCLFGGVAVTAGGVTTKVCNGAPGGPGPIGGGLYTSRSDVYCNRLSSLPAGEHQLIATCDTNRDLALSGSCEFYDDRIAVVGTSRPWNWDGASVAEPAGWECTYASNGVSINGPQAAARATVCCIRNP